MLLNFRQILTKMFRDFSKMQEQQEKIPNGQRGADSAGPTARGRQRGADSGGPAQYTIQLAHAAPLGLPAALRDIILHSYYDDEDSKSEKAASRRHTPAAAT